MGLILDSSLLIADEREAFDLPGLTGCVAVRLTWPSTAGKTYRVEHAEHLGASGWVPLGEDHLAEGVALTVIDSMGSRSQRFYRVLQVR